MSKTQENIKKTIEKVIEDFSKTLNNLSGNLQKSVSEIEETNNITEVKTLRRYIYNFISISSYVDSGYYSNATYVRFSFNTSGLKLFPTITELLLPFKNRLEQYSENSYKFPVKETDQSKNDVKEFIKLFETFLEIDKKVYEENVKIAETNLKLKNTLYGIIQQMNIPTCSYQPVSSRSSKTELTLSPWYTSLASNFQTSTENFNENAYKKFEEDVWKVFDKVVGEISKKKLEKEKEQALAEKKRREDSLFSEMVSKYSLKDTVDWREILDVILSKDKHLELADEMLMTRNSFDNGIDGIESLAAQLSDENIKKSVLETCENWDGDGRAFRDCDYSYDYFFGLVDKELLEDYQRVSSKVERF